MTPCCLLVTPYYILLNPEHQSAVIGAETTCVSPILAFVIVIRLVYKSLCYWPLRIYFDMLASDCCITFIQWKARIQDLLLCDLDTRWQKYGAILCWRSSVVSRFLKIFIIDKSYMFQFVSWIFVYLFFQLYIQFEFLKFV